MNRLTKGALVALATMSIAVAGCQEQGVDDDLESLDTLPSIDTNLPSQSADDGSMESMEMEPSDEASPSDDM